MKYDLKQLNSVKRAPEETYHKIREYFPFSCVDLLIFNEQRILLTKRTIEPFKGMWHLPGTMIRKSETMIDAVNRSAREELGVEIEVIKYHGVYESIDQYRHDISHGFVVKIIKGEIKTDFQSTEYEFYKECPENTVHHHKKMITDVLKNQV